MKGFRIIAVGLGILIVGGGFFIWRNASRLPPSVVETSMEVPALSLLPEPVPVIAHVHLPEEVRGIYWNAQTGGNARGEELISYMKETGLNAVVIDAKADNGALAFAPHDESLVQYQMKTPLIANLDGVLLRLKEAGIYRIARVTVMKDNAFARAHPEEGLHTKDGTLWQDKTGSLWADPMSELLRAYAIALGEELYARGFDEIQYDYIRYPSDGVISRIVYPHTPPDASKINVMADVFATIGDAMRAQGIPVSFDLFGMTYWREDDFGIGQRLKDVYPHADFISPMLYPSHFPDTFEGFANPAEQPYEIVKRSVDHGSTLLEAQNTPPADVRRKTRVWIQDFDIGAVYTSDLIEAEIKAARDAGASGWMLWNARNVYEKAEYLEKD
ncbi:hypothetical protein HYV73_01260 [Candidatus Uhrbacteria bacterium]|nr:hypothetical protein [Candidatus Uhrbacteria bacterium]